MLTAFGLFCRTHDTCFAIFAMMPLLSYSVRDERGIIAVIVKHVSRVMQDKPSTFPLGEDILLPSHKHWKDAIIGRLMELHALSIVSFVKRASAVVHCK